MIEKLSKLHLPVDNLFKELYGKESLDPIIKSLQLCNKPQNNITSRLVSHTKIVATAKRYIWILLQEKERFGYLYFLNAQHMIIPLDVQFKGELFIDPNEKEIIIDALDEMASKFACRGTVMHQITKIELFYFFIRLVNLNMTWLEIEYRLQSMKWHAHLLISPDRKYTWVEKKEGCFLK